MSEDVRELLEAEMKIILPAMILTSVLGIGAMGNAQDRMPPIPVDKMTPDQKKAVEEFRAVRQAELSGPFIPLLRSPEVMTRTRVMGDYLRCKSILPSRLSEFLILMTSRHWTQQYEWNAHCPIGLRAGLWPGVARTMAAGRRAG